MAEITSIFNKNEAEEVIRVGKAIVKTDDQLVKFTTDTEALILLLGKQGTSLSTLLGHYEKVKKGSKELDTVGKQLASSEEKLKNIEDSRAKQIVKNNEESKKKLAALKEEVTGTKAAAGAKKTEAKIAKQLLIVKKAESKAILEGVKAKRKAIIEANKRNGTYAKEQIILQRQRAEFKLLLKAKMAAVGSDKQLSAVISILNNRFTNLNKTTVDGKAKAKHLGDTIDRLNAKLTASGTAASKQKRNIGNYGSALAGVGAKARMLMTQLAGALGLTSAIFVLVNMFKSAFSTIRDFTKENAVLAGVLGKTRDEVVDLTDQSIILAAQYPVLSSEVTKLQVSYARLGFTQAEIISLTEATILGSIALNSSLDETATLVGAVVKAYHSLGTTDSSGIIDQLALSTQRSSLSFESLKTALPKVAGAADALNESLSGTLSKLAIAQDATLDASTAGTSLRNIYLEITKRGLTYNEALAQIDNSSNKLGAAFELFGKRGAIVGLALANNKDKAEELRIELDETGGVAERVAKEQMDTLDGSIKSFSSSWEKLILGFKDSDGVWRKVIDSATQFLDTFSDDRISRFNKYIEIFTLGIWGLATEQQQALTEFEKRISKSNSKQIQYTLNLHKEEFEHGSKFEKAKLYILKKGLGNKLKLESEFAENKIKLDAKAKADAALLILINAKEAKAASGKRKQILAGESRERVKKLGDEISEKIEYYGELDELSDENTESLSELLDEEQEIIDSALSDKIEANIAANDKLTEDSKEASDKRIADAKEETIKQKQLEEQKRQSKYQTLEAVKLIAGEETAVGKLAVAAQRALAIQQNLISLGVITAKSAEGEAKSAAALPFPLNIPLILGTIAQFIGITSLFKSIPAFADGTESTPSEFIAGDKKGGGSARELMKLKTGKLMMVDSPTHFKGNEFKGATIKSNPETEKIIEQSEKRGNFTFDTSDLKTGLSRIEKAINKKPVSITDSSGRIIGKQMNNSRETYLNRLRNGR